MQKEQPFFDINKLSIDENCSECAMSFCDPKPNELVMFLHACKYSGAGWSFETKLPAWAKEDWTEFDVK